MLTTPSRPLSNHLKTKSKKTSANPNKTNNLTNNEVKALTELQKRDDIIIINADKGGAITILDTDEYIKETNRQLNNELENTTYMTEEEVTTFLEKREDSWKIKLDTFIPDGFNQELHFPR